MPVRSLPEYISKFLVIFVLVHVMNLDMSILLLALCILAICALLRQNSHNVPLKIVWPWELVISIWAERAPVA
jgi:hypothetical protein